MKFFKNRKINLIYLLVLFVLGLVIVNLNKLQTPKALFAKTKEDLSVTTYLIAEKRGQMYAIADQIAELEELKKEDPELDIDDELSGLEDYLAILTEQKEYLDNMNKNLRTANWELEDHNEFTNKYYLAMEEYYFDVLSLLQVYPAKEDDLIEVLNINKRSIPFKIFELEQAIEKNFTSSQYQWQQISKVLFNFFNSLIPYILILICMMDINLLYLRKKSLYAYIPATYNRQTRAYFSRKVINIFLSAVVLVFLCLLINAFNIPLFDFFSQSVFLVFLGEVISVPNILALLAPFIMLLIFCSIAFLLMDIFYKLLSDKINAFAVSIGFLFFFGYITKAFMQRSYRYTYHNALNMPHLFIENISLSNLSDISGGVSPVEIYLAAIPFLALIWMCIFMIHKEVWKK